jgi:polyhydroxybutyrate depolymerase
MKSGKFLRLRPALAAAFCFSFLFATLLATRAGAQETKEKVTVDDVDRNFMLRLPRGYDAQKHYPVMILLHGSNQDADDIERLTRFNETADKVGIIAIYPLSANGRWNIGVRPQEHQRSVMGPGSGRHRGGGGYPGGGGGGYPGGGGGYPRGGQQPQDQQPSQHPSEDSRHGPADDIAFFNQMLDQVSAKASVDASRIYAAGLSEGGFMALRVGCAMSDRIAGIAAIGAAMPKTMICLPSRPVSLVMMNGTQDPVVPYGGGTEHNLNLAVLSVEESGKAWARIDHCGEKPDHGKLPSSGKGATETKVDTFPNCGQGSTVVSYSLKGMGNTWPGGLQYEVGQTVGKTSDDINANEILWNILSTKTLPEKSDPAK